MPQATLIMKTLTEASLIEALETMAAHFQWQTCSLQVDRKPDGVCRFWAYVGPDPDKGLDGASAFGNTPQEAAQGAIKQNPMPLPEASRDRAIRKLEEQLAKLRAVTFPLPPYRPGTYLPEHASETMDV
jgi:hypothetical protein